nr:MAG TPA: protein of unknown function (DUF5351) [Caudoviricetes sp.]
MCNYCGGSGMINMSPSDTTFGFLSELINSAFCSYCDRGRELRKRFYEEQAKPNVKLRTSSRNEFYVAAGIKK